MNWGLEKVWKEEVVAYWREVRKHENLSDDGT
jgi:hypothetical protein